MLDKRKRRIDTLPDTPKESEMPAANAKQLALSEVEQVAKRISSNRQIRERIKVSIDDVKSGRVLTPEEAIKRLKKRAS
jgi:hypothetical protein